MLLLDLIPYYKQAGSTLSLDLHSRLLVFPETLHPQTGPIRLWQYSQPITEHRYSLNTSLQVHLSVRFRFEIVSALLMSTVSVPLGSSDYVNRIAVKSSDFALFLTPNDLFRGMWVNGTTMNTFGFHPTQVAPPPSTTPCPYLRLATFTNLNSSIVYVYHQLSPTVIAEDTYNWAIGNWLSNNITIEAT